MNRRFFLRQTGVGLSALGLAPWWAARAAEGAELKADVVVVGGGLGGVAAAIAAARQGLKVILTEETDWIGGQVSQQGVPPDEHPWIENFGCTRDYRRFRDGARAYYREHFPLTANARANPRLNPGNGWVSRVCHEPRVAVAVLWEMLAPYCAGQHIRVLLRHRAVAAETQGDRVISVTVHDTDSDQKRVLVAPYFIDATELGDLLALSKTEHVIGAESRKDTGEMHAGEERNPLNQQAITWCFALDYLPEQDFTIPKPEEYEFWRGYTPAMTPAWPGRLLSWAMTDPFDNSRREVTFDPTEKAPGTNLWTYRRLADPANFLPGTYPGAISLVNWPQNDYWIGPLLGVEGEQVARHLRRARQLSLSLVYWMQTEAPRPDGGTGWKGLRLRGDTLGTADGLAKYPYIREARRIQAEFTVVEQHVGTEARMQLTGQAKETVTAEVYPDSVGVGSYRIDLHPSTSGANYLDISSLPFQIPLGALLPKRVDNLLPAAKNLGTTHITNGCYRLHPVEWNIGEAAGALAGFALRQKEPPRQVRMNKDLLAQYQAELRQAGVELEWPKLRPV